MALTVRALSAISRASLDRELENELELFLGVPSDEGLVFGSFDRGPLKRGSGGAAELVGPGTVWVQLVIARPIVDVTRLLNRYVRPLLAAMSKLGPPARYFGRDFVSVDHRPAARIAFAHDAVTNRALFEAFVPLGDRAMEAIRTAYVAMGATEVTPIAEESEPPEEPPWSISIDEPIGRMSAGRDREGTKRLGGELMASRQVIADLEAGVISPTAWLFGADIANARALLDRLV